MNIRWFEFSPTNPSPLALSKNGILELRKINETFNSLPTESTLFDMLKILSKAAAFANLRELSALLKGKADPSSEMKNQIEKTKKILESPGKSPTQIKEVKEIFEEE